MGEGLLSIDVEDCEFGDRIVRDVHNFVLSLDDSWLVPGNARALSGRLWFEPSMVHFYLSWTRNLLVCDNMLRTHCC